MPKNTTPTKKKVVSSKNQRTVPTIVGVIVLVVIGVALALAGSYAYNNYKANSLKAKAGSWKPLGTSPYNGGKIAAWGCADNGKATVLYVIDSKKPYPYVNLGAAGTNKGGGSSSRAWWGYVTTMQSTFSKDVKLFGGHSRDGSQNAKLFSGVDGNSLPSCK